MQLWTRRSIAWQLGWKCGRARFRASINRCRAAVALVWDRRAETKIFAARRGRRDFRLRADGKTRRVGPGDDESPSRTHSRWQRVHLKRRKALVHQRRESGRPCGDGAYAFEDGGRERTQ